LPVTFSGSVSAPQGDKLAVVVTEFYDDYQWYWNGTAIADAVSQVLDLDTAAYAVGTHRLAVIATDAAGRKYSGTLTVELTR
jgi:hypothetical protein